MKTTQTFSKISQKHCFLFPHFLEPVDITIPFPCQFRQNEIELCKIENQDRVNEFQFRFREKNFRQYETEFCQIRNNFLCEIEFRYGGNEFRSCKIDSLFGKVELHVGDF